MTDPAPQRPRRVAFSELPLTLRSMRLRAFLVVVLVALAPLIFVGLWELMGSPRAADGETRVVAWQLTVFVLPTAILLGAWLAWRVVRPIENLRLQLLSGARAATPSARLELERRDEFGDLAAAFNALLEALGERSRANEAFVADLVHELKNPVAAVRAAAERLEAATEGVTPERAARLARVLDDASRRMDALVTELLELARAEAGLPSETREEVDITALVHGLVEARRARHEELSFVVSGEGPPIHAAATALESAIRNLLGNAARHARNEVRAELEVRSNELELRVQDDGEGIPQEQQARIFDRFFTTRAGAEGTGLGLALVRAVAEAHGGRVAVSSEPDRGACFTLHLPLAR